MNTFMVTQGSRVAFYIMILIAGSLLLAGCSSSEDDNFYWRVEWSSEGSCLDPNQRGGGSLGTFDPGTDHGSACGERSSHLQKARLRLSIRFIGPRDTAVFSLEIESEVGFGEDEDLQRVMRPILWAAVIDELYRFFGDPEDWPSEVIACLPLAETQVMTDREERPLDYSSQLYNAADPHCFTRCDIPEQGPIPFVVEYSLDLGEETAPSD
jgi:hypothetical protein